MAPSGPSAANSCLPANSPVILSVPPVPSPERGERCPLDGNCGSLSKEKAVLGYSSGKLVVLRELDGKTVLPHDPVCKLSTLVYRGHHHPVTALKMSPSGAYCVSGDVRGSLRVWAFDHEEHLCRYEQQGFLSGPIRDMDWDGESKRIVVGGERSGADVRSDCAKAIGYDTGVTVGQLAAHVKGRCASVAMKPQRPMRCVTAGKDDTKTCFHKGPPFAKIPSVESVPCESAHSKGAVNCVRYNKAGTLGISVSTDRSLCVYEGKTWTLLNTLSQIHSATIYGCAWSGDDKHVMTASGDGTCKLFEVVNEEKGELKEIHTWNPAQVQNGGEAFDKVPVGGVQLGCTFVQGNRPVSVGFNGQLSLLPMPGSSKEISIVTGHNSPIDDMTVDLQRQTFYTGDTNGLLCEWDLPTVTCRRRIIHHEGNGDLMHTVHGGAVSGVAVIPGTGALLSVGWDDKLYVTPNGSPRVQGDPVALGAQPTAVAAGGKQIAVIATVQGLLVVPAGSGGKKVSSMINCSYQAQALCISADDKTVYVGGDDHKIHIYSVEGGGDTLKETHVIEDGHLHPIHALALSNDGSKLVSADTRDICVFDIQSAGPEKYIPLIARGRWCFHVQRVTCLAWSPDDKFIASGGADDSIYLWSLQQKMKRIHYPYAHRGGLVGLAFLPSTGGGDLKYQFLSVGVDTVVNKWDATKDVKEKFG